MEPFSITALIALSMGTAWASGINLYAALLMLGILGGSGTLDLPGNLEVLQHPLVIGAAGLMYVVEFITDKLPGIDSTWDALHTFVRIPAGAVLAASAFGEMDPAIMLAAGLIGGTVSAGTHATKAGTRMLANTSPEPFSNIALSISEDVVVFAGLWAALNHPWIFLALLLLFLVFIAWALPKLWRGIRAVFRKLVSLFRGKKDPAPA